MNNSIDTTRNWPLIRLILFRFFATYFGIYVLFNMPLLVFDTLSDHIWDIPVTWVGRLLVSPGFKITVWSNGSGDTTFNYLALFCQAILALALSIIWWAFDYKRKNYDKLLYWLMVIFRYALAVSMMNYGGAKIAKTQFPFPWLFQLEQPLGQSSPMGLAWVYMGHSTGYNLFIGFAEFFGGFFLLFRRTKLFGALLSMTIMVNIMAMNFFYDIPVKLFSTHLFCIALFITLPDFNRLINFFFLNKPVPAQTSWYPIYQRKWKRITHIALKYFAVAIILYTQICGIRFSQKRLNKNNAIPPLYGIYEVKNIVYHNYQATPIADSSLRWKKIYIDRGGYVFAHDIRDNVNGEEAKFDTIHKNISWQSGNNNIQLHYTVPAKDSLTLNGKVGADSVSIALLKKDANNFILVTRGFHWINEHSYNK
ncbi:hypothetical protein CLV51_104165 [Chitinophaga niastensis]|uniref:DoxX-like protein n=1 Tax=Chitinophaga niastensis TaxID=536980 RepID=A0A2P8HGX2_CHINA|nr:hypothetical protein [Chitinophaga niastensis]PSL45462.1 hypothetical protein CLV51_104165 [Chitinophaga niastensis]